jgi:hypothetical protein
MKRIELRKGMWGKQQKNKVSVKVSTEGKLLEGNG